ncbi:hypothetical protein N7G274_007869 [Stereocaulon virgatum]|uniref:Uncharacterized protein n=1 Tax=Stereocaulon virgatum TaxID=373712 RepID=A0ABR4A2Q4_9LECA
MHLTLSRRRYATSMNLRSIANRAFRLRWTNSWNCTGMAALQRGYCPISMGAKARLLFLLNLLAYIIRMPCRSIFPIFRWFVHYAQRPSIILGGSEESDMVNRQALVEVKILIECVFSKRFIISLIN